MPSSQRRCRFCRISPVSGFNSSRSEGHATHAADHRTPQPELPGRDVRLGPRGWEGTIVAAAVHRPWDPATVECRTFTYAVGQNYQTHPPLVDPKRLAVSRLRPPRPSAHRETAGGAVPALSALSVLSALSAQVVGGGWKANGGLSGWRWAVKTCCVLFSPAQGSPALVSSAFSAASNRSTHKENHELRKDSGSRLSGLTVLPARINSDNLCR